MYGSHQSFDYGDFDGDFAEADSRRPRQSGAQASGRTRRHTSNKKRTSRKRSAAATVLGISHRRNHKWAW